MAVKQEKVRVCLLRQQEFQEELDNAKKIYDKQMWFEKNKDDSAPISKNMPQVAGNLQWAHEIRQRVTVPVTSLRQLDHQ